IKKEGDTNLLKTSVSLFHFKFSQIVEYLVDITSVTSCSIIYLLLPPIFYHYFRWSSRLHPIQISLIFLLRISFFLFTCIKPLYEHEKFFSNSTLSGETSIDIGVCVYEQLTPV